MEKINFDLEIQKCKFRISQLKLNIEQFNLRIAELADEQVRLSENIPATEKEIDLVMKQIEQYEKTKAERATKQ